MCCPCCKSMCCRIINAAIVFFFFACLGLAAIDFAFIFKRWQAHADTIAKMTGATECTLTAPTKPTFSHFNIRDWFTTVPMGTQIDDLKCNGGSSGTNTALTCQFSQPGDAYLFASKQLTVTGGKKVASGTIEYYVPCYVSGTTLNSKFVYVGFVLCAVGLAIAIFVPIIILACKNRM